MFYKIKLKFKIKARLKNYSLYNTFFKKNKIINEITNFSDYYQLFTKAVKIFKRLLIKGI